MTAQVLRLSTYEWIEISIPVDARPTDRLFPVFIEDDSLELARIYKNDVAIVNLACQPCQGQFAAIEALQGFLLGYCFELPNGLIRVESACNCPDCPPQYIPQSSISKYGPVSWVYRCQGNGCITFGYRKIRAKQKGIGAA
jgi:hypothetical protein